MIDYLNGQFLPHEDARVSPDDRGFLFADGIYEVIRFYGGHAFRQDRHLARLSFGAAALRFPETSFPELPHSIAMLLEQNHLQKADALVYLQITRGSAPRTHHFPPPATPLTLYMTAKSFPVAPLHPEGLKVIIVPDDRWSRCNLKTTSLLANTLAYQQAMDAGAHEALFSRAGNIMEGSHSNVAIVKNGTLFTPPLNNFILAGITREAVLELCRALGLPVVEAAVSEGDLLDADEIMVFSTTLEVTPVVAVNGVMVRGGGAGAVTVRLRVEFRKFVRSHAI